jgi:hypothetical protein
VSKMLLQFQYLIWYFIVSPLAIALIGVIMIMLIFLIVEATTFVRFVWAWIFLGVRCDIREFVRAY